ncbi:response regulator transcription factor [Dongia sp.]|uniref:response regulator transcription factor n=1 Tax=Dongia sp. TaxID=1977262 RepID=UPI0035ADE7BD
MPAIEMTVPEAHNVCPRALVIDDDPLVRDLTAEILRRAGYSVYLAADGIDGMAQARALRPSLVITDIFMPQQDGIEVLRQVKREMPGTRVVALSGGSPLLPRLDILTVATKLGADAVLAKPFTPTELLAVATANDWGPDSNVQAFSGPFRRSA